MTPDTDLRNVDLNLLLVFDVLYRTRSTTRAAESLHLTQPSVSNALKRLRRELNLGMAPQGRSRKRLAP